MRVLIADDEFEFACILANAVESWNHEVVATVTTGGLDVIRLYNRYKPDVVIMDIMMPKLNGLTACRALLSKDPNAKIIFSSGKYRSDSPLINHSGAVGFLQKPIHLFEVRQLLDKLDPHKNEVSLDLKTAGSN